MANPYIGPVDMETILEAACAMTSGRNHPSWPTVVNYLGKVGIDEAYIQENETYIRERLNRYSGNIHDANTESTPRHSPRLHPQQRPTTPPDSGRTLNRYRNLDDSRLAASSPHSNGQRISQLNPLTEINKTEFRSLPYGKFLLRSAPLSKGRPFQMRPARVWSFKRSDWHPATTTEGLTFSNFVRRELIEVADLQVEELDKSNQALSGNHDVYTPEGLAVIAIQQEGCIQTLTEEFLVTSDKDAPDLSIGHDLSAKIEHFRNVIRSNQKMIDHYRYGGGLEPVSGNSESGLFLGPRNRTNHSVLPDEEPSRRRPYTPPSLRSPGIDQQGSEIPDGLAGADEKSPLIPRRLPVSSEPHSSSDTNNHPLGSTVTRSRTTDAQVQADQAGAILPVSTVPVASGHEPSNSVILRLTIWSLLGCGAGVVVLTMSTSFLTAYLVQRWDI
jgi:hypothetical protein